MAADVRVASVAAVVNGEAMEKASKSILSLQTSVVVGHTVYLHGEASVAVLKAVIEW